MARRGGRRLFPMQWGAVSNTKGVPSYSPRLGAAGSLPWEFRYKRGTNLERGCIACGPEMQPFQGRLRLRGWGTPGGPPASADLGLYDEMPLAFEENNLFKAVI